MLYIAPNQPTSKLQFKARYGNFIGGNWVAPVNGQYFDNVSPVNGEVFCQIPRSSAEDIELALDAAHAARDAWGKTSVTVRSNLLLKIADRLEANLEVLARLSKFSNFGYIFVSGLWI